MAAARMRRVVDDEKEHLVIYTCELHRWSRFGGVPHRFAGAARIPGARFCRPCGEEAYAVRRYLRRLYRRAA